MSRGSELAERLDAVRSRIRSAAQACGRDPGSILLLPVTKFHPASDVGRLRDLGVTAVGENRVQDALEKAALYPDVPVHLIGRIQTNKANAAARVAAVVHSLDSTRLAVALDRGVGLAVDRGHRPDTQLPVLVQFSADGDPARGGVPEAGMGELLDTLSDCPHLRLSGVMCVPPLGCDPADVFAAAAELRDRFAAAEKRPMELSAGMSGDLEDAVAAGSTMVRVGTAILGPRR
ncbi:YggS family pyridoxal phosphate-dependent enzyme [Corynebacterium pygosceleis]|uniref:YggS family pyridoxal phosphate-dependent enzyme n=1 Tax=Corynebacterium pygosceleis TaxID=2800406 RepID=UPI0019030DAC|nr:YggS family pyridoxal phosphate-dependent enzyme [Corynebacterium pygosceleis]MCL0120557.1 YggS family pyridoxal phosphate-dependent enzyme [Corynebacterium pygosceleis]